MDDPSIFETPVPNGPNGPTSYDLLMMREQYQQQLPQVKTAKGSAPRNGIRQPEKVNKLTALGSKGQPICSIYGMKPPIKLINNKNKKNSQQKNTTAGTLTYEQPILPDIKELNKILS